MSAGSRKPRQQARRPLSRGACVSLQRQPHERWHPAHGQSAPGRVPAMGNPGGGFLPRRTRSPTPQLLVSPAQPERQGEGYPRYLPPRITETARPRTRENFSGPGNQISKRGHRSVPTSSVDAHCRRNVHLTPAADCYARGVRDGDGQGTGTRRGQDGDGHAHVACTSRARIVLQSLPANVRRVRAMRWRGLDASAPKPSGFEAETQQKPSGFFS